METETATITIITDRHVNAQPKHVRGFVANRNPNSLLLHQHQGSGTDHKYIYLYPRVQYRVQGEKVVICAIAEGVGAAIEATKDLESLYLAGEKYRVVGLDTIETTSDFQSIESEREYEFRSPWLALSQTNYQRYKQCATTARQSLLERILIGNFLSCAKSLGHHVDSQIVVKTNFRPNCCYVKNQEMLGFVGRFRVNFAFPEQFGLGHLASIGFGEVALSSRVGKWK